MNPADSLPFLEHYGVVLLPALTIAEQIGIPLPAVPALLAVGASGRARPHQHPARARGDRRRGPDHRLCLV